MKVNVTKDNVTIQDKCLIKVHEGEYNVNELDFTFSEDYTGDLVINAVFSVEGEKAYQMSVINNKCSIPAEVLENPGRVTFGVYAYKIIEDQLDLRYSPYPDFFVVISGSYDPTAEEGQEITASQFEQYMQALQDGLNEVDETLKGVEEKGDYAKEQGDYAKEQAENVKNANEEATKIIDNFEDNVQSYTTDFNNNAETKKTDFNNNYDQKLQSFNSNVSDQITSFNENATEKTNAFNLNSETKISDFNENAVQKTNDFNENASNKTNQFNQNIDKFYKAYHNQPTNQAEGSSISLDDSSDQDLTDFSVFGKSTQVQTKGYQLLDLQDGQVTSNGITTICKKGILKATGTTNSSWFNLINNTPISLEPGQYTVSIDEPIETNTIILSLQGTSWQDITINKNMKTTTFTINETKTMVALRCDGGSSGTKIDHFFKIMLNTGNAAKNFEIFTGRKASPSPSYPQEIKNTEDNLKIEIIGKNHFDINNMILGGNAQYYTKNEKDELLVTNIDTRNEVSYFIKVKKNTIYTISYTNNPTKDCGIRVYAKGSTFYFAYSDNQNYLTFNTGENSEIGIKFVERASFPVNIGNVQLSIEDRTTEYEPYESFVENIALDESFCSVNEIFDEIEFQKDENNLLINKLNFIKNIKRIILTGTENWQIFDTAEQGKERYYIPLNDAKAPLKNEELANILCNYFQPKTALDTYKNVEGVSIDSKGRLIIYNSDIDNSVNDFKEWLTNNEVIIQYEMKESFITTGTCTVPQTFKNQTNITNDKDCNMKIGYIQDTNSVIKKINDKISVLENNEIGG